MNKTRRKNIDKTTRLLNQTFESGSHAFGGRTLEVTLRNGDVTLTRTLLCSLYKDYPIIFRIKMIFQKDKAVRTFVHVKRELHTFDCIAEIVEHKAEKDPVQHRIDHIQLLIHYEATRMYNKRITARKADRPAENIEQLADVWDMDLKVGNGITSTMPTRIYMRPFHMLTKDLTRKGPQGGVRTYRVEYVEEPNRGRVLTLKFYTIKRTYDTISKMSFGNPPKGTEMTIWTKQQVALHETQLNQQ